MSFKATWLVGAVALAFIPLICHGQEVIDQWSESQVIERFLAQSAQAREQRARVALSQAEARTRITYPNPSVSYSREGAGYNEFFEGSQTLLLSGRMAYLRQAGAAAVSVSEANREAALWSLRNDLRAAFYRMLAAQERLKILLAGATEFERLIQVLRKREEEGEGSRYDRLRAEREAAEWRFEIASARSRIAASSAQVAAYLPEGTHVRQVAGGLLVNLEAPEVEDLIRRAMNARADYRAEQKSLARYQIEEQAARRLRIPDPQITAGVKRADVTSGLSPNPFSNVTHTGVTVGISVPLPIFNDGRYEVARYKAEQEQSSFRAAVLARQIRTEIQGARDVLAIRRDALASYQRELESAGADLTQITRIAYQEGQVGILELLDSLRVNRAGSLRMLDLRAEVKEAWIELERAVGEEIRP